MFGFFKKKKPSSPYEAFLSWPDDEFVVAVQKILSENVPASHAMYVVAYQNQAPMVTAIERLPMEDPSPEEYASRLFYDGINKSWIKG
jgi:hypothetical protein